MAEKVDPLEQRNKVQEVTAVEYGKLQIEYGRLKLELERTREESSAHLMSERKNAKISQQLIDELNRKVNELESPGILSPDGRRGSILLKEEFIENLVLGKTGLESKFSEQKQEISVLPSELKSTKRKLETETANISKLRETQGKVENMRRKSDSDFEIGDFLVAKEDIFEGKKHKQNSKAELIGLELKFKKLQRENDELSNENKTLTQEFHKHERDKAIARQISDDALITAKDGNERLRCYVRSMEKKMSQEAHRSENMELYLKALQGREEELNQVNREYQEAVNTNKVLQLRMDSLREEKDALLGKGDIKNTELENKNLELRKKLRKLESVFQEEPDELRETILTQSLRDTSHHQRSERDIREVESHQNAPRKIYPMEQTRGYQASEQITLTRSKSERRVEGSETPCLTDLNTSKTPLGVRINWVKEFATLEREIIYFDNIHEPVTLTWIDMEQLFQGAGTFSVGKHFGSISLPTHGDMHDVQPFEVRKGMDVLTLKLVDTVNKYK